MIIHLIKIQSNWLFFLMNILQKSFKKTYSIFYFMNSLKDEDFKQIKEICNADLNRMTTKL